LSGGFRKKGGGGLDKLKRLYYIEVSEKKMREGGVVMMAGFERALKVGREVVEGGVYCGFDVFVYLIWQEVEEQIGRMGMRRFEKFKKLVAYEYESRGWDYRRFRNGNNGTVLNLFKKVLRVFTKEEGVELTNDALSRILNFIRRVYGLEGELVAAVFPVEAFRRREEWGIDKLLGDERSCFLEGKVNEGNVDWLIFEYKRYGRAFFVVFNYKQNGGEEGWGRCWVYKLGNAVLVFNFYSYGFDIHYWNVQEAVQRLLARLFDVGDGMNFKVEYIKNGFKFRIPVYLNGDGFILYKGSFEEVLKEFNEVRSMCLGCGREVFLGDLGVIAGEVKFNGRHVAGLVACKECMERGVDGKGVCIDCGGVFDVEDMVFLVGENNGSYVCHDCYEERWFNCEFCGKDFRRDYMVVAEDMVLLCEDCAREVGSFCYFCGEFHYFESGLRRYRVVDGFYEGEEYICNRCFEGFKGSSRLVGLNGVVILEEIRS
jgi:hypothetical protein